MPQKRGDAGCGVAGQQPEGGACTNPYRLAVSPLSSPYKGGGEWWRSARREEAAGGREWLIRLCRRAETEAGRSCEVAGTSL